MNIEDYAVSNFIYYYCIIRAAISVISRNDIIKRHGGLNDLITFLQESGQILLICQTLIYDQISAKLMTFLLGSAVILSSAN